MIICPRVTSMFGAVNILEKKSEERVGQPPGLRRVRKVDVDDEHGDEAGENVEAESVEPDEGVLRPEDAVVVAVEEVAVLL